VLFYGAALVVCPAVADETTILFNVTIAYILYFYVCLMYNKAIKQITTGQPPYTITSAVMVNLTTLVAEKQWSKACFDILKMQ